MSRVVEYQHIEDLNASRTAWGRLLDETPGGSFFQSLEWLQLYWRHFGVGQRLRVLVAESDDGVLGILPLVVRPEHTRAGRVRVLTYPLQDWGSFYGPVGPNPTATLAICLDYLRRRRRDWDLLDLRWVDKSRVDHGRTPLALCNSGFPNREHLWRKTAIVDLAGTWEQYLAGRSGKFRGNLRRAESAARAAGQISFERYRPCAAKSEASQPRWEYFDECLELAARSWQASSLTGTTITHPSVREFFRDLFGLAAQAGALDLNLLRCDGRLIAFAYNLVSAGEVTGLRIGFDHDSSAISPGRLLLACSIEDSFRRGDRLLDLGSETMEFKRQWLTSTLDIFHYTYYPMLSLRSQLLRTKHWLCTRQHATKDTAAFV